MLLLEHYQWDTVEVQELLDNIQWQSTPILKAFKTPTFSFYWITLENTILEDRRRFLVMAWGLSGQKMRDWTITLLKQEQKLHEKPTRDLLDFRTFWSPIIIEVDTFYGDIAFWAGVMHKKA